MKQLFASKSGRHPLEAPMPTPGDNEIMVAVYSSAISTGTETMSLGKGDMTLTEKLNEKKQLLDKVMRVIKSKGLGNTIKLIKGKLNPAEQAILYKPVGYSNAGTVIAKGRLVKNFNAGDRVACAGAGIASHAEYVTIPVNLAVKIPERLSFDAAAFTTIGAIAMQGIRRANVTFGETIVITGLGLLGLIAVQIAKAWGLVVIGTDLNPLRLKLAEELGADYCFDARESDLVEKIKEVTHGYGADAVIIYAATKNSEPANQALAACRRKGRVVIVGSVGMDLQRDAMYSNELDFVMSTSYGPGRYDNQYEEKGIDYPIGYVRWTENRNMMEFTRLLASGEVKVDSLISKKFKIEQASEAYNTLVQNPSENISCIFEYAHEDDSIPDSRMQVQRTIKASEKIGVGIIGAGGFIQKNHLANILSMPEKYSLIGIAEKTTASAKTVSEQYPLRYVSTNYKELLGDPEVDLIIIGTRHNLHATLVTDSIKSGKNVLVEKPLAMTHEELRIIENAFAENRDVVATVGFNRRYSPFIQEARKVISRNASPIAINYRVNAGYIAPGNWVQDLEEGGGRVIGEVCHFIDLISYLVSGKIREMNVVHVPIDGRHVQTEDNLILNMSFSDGSIGSLIYTSLGGKAMGKERIEIFTGGSSLVIDDFMELQAYNCAESGFKIKYIDKGHKALVAELAKKLKGEESLILPFETDIEMSRLTLMVLDQMHALKLPEN